MPITDGMGQPVPPPVTRETLEQQRACERLAMHIIDQMEQNLSSARANIEVDVSPTWTRFVVHYRLDGRHPRSQASTVEANFGPGDPLDHEPWIRLVAQAIVDHMQAGDSDFFIFSSINYLRICDEDGKTLYQRGKPWLAITTHD